MSPRRNLQKNLDLIFGGPWYRDKLLRTNPRWIYPLVIDLVNIIEEYEGTAEQKREFATNVATLILYDLIQVRNKDKVLLTKPKNLVIAQVINLLDSHFRRHYRSNAPRLPQIAIYAIYECLLVAVKRYEPFFLDPLAKMKAADRKAGTVGDIVLRRDGVSVEAVEIKLGQPIDINMVSEAIEKIRTASVDRYFILSTANVMETEREDIERLCREFRNSNGCEIIVNGVLETLGYYLRLLPNTSEFINRYTERVESDHELGYEHRIAWNEICAEFAGP